MARVREVLDIQNGPTLLVAHSYGGAVITQMGADPLNVGGLVYVAAFAPDEGETAKQLATAEPQSAAIQAFCSDQEGYIWLDPDGFRSSLHPM